MGNAIYCTFDRKNEDIDVNCHEPVKLNLLLYYYPNHITHYYLIRIAYQSPAYARQSITTLTAAQPMTTLQYQLTRIQFIE